MHLKPTAECQISTLIFLRLHFHHRRDGHISRHYCIIFSELYLVIFVSGRCCGRDHIDLLIPMQSVPITTNVVRSNPAQMRCTEYSIM